MYYLSLARVKDSGIGGSFSFRRVERDVLLMPGYLGMKDYQSFLGSLEFGRRRKSNFFNYFWVALTGEVVQDTAAQTKQQRFALQTMIKLWKRSTFSFSIGAGEEANQLRKGSDLYWDEKVFPYRSFILDYRMNRIWFIKNIRFRSELRRRGIYRRDFGEVVDGKEKRFICAMTFKPWSFMDYSLSMNFIEQREYQRDSLLWKGVTLQSDLFLQMSRAFYLNLYYNAETRLKQYNLGVLFCYDFGSGSLVQFGLKSSKELFSDEYEAGFTVFLKISYLLRI